MGVGQVPSQGFPSVFSTSFAQPPFSGALAAAPSRMRHQENHIRARVQAWQPGAHPTGAPHRSGAHAAGTQRTWGRRVAPHPFTALLALPLVLQVSTAPLWARAWCPPGPQGPPHALLAATTSTRLGADLVAGVSSLPSDQCSFPQLESDLEQKTK